LATNINDRLFFQEKLMDNDSFLILGIPERKFIDGQHFSYNSVMVMYPNGSFSTYQKLFLVPFAEYVPFFKSWLTKINQFDDMGNFTPGTEYKIFPIKDYKIATLICYDSSDPKIVKTMVQNGADILFIITNDSYVGEFMPYQHFELAKLRAIEQRIPVVQSANNGISGIILPSGKVVYRSNLNERVVHTEKIPIYE
jgi:apolipoprotein N-acyltransferase